ncbi:hypothetical protein I4F81_008745 [Pyropia yezoensis]|uniref:Uncharacterized protein n=1 Tax=Pyropia yezoensis TaxID=2788 RepID=A0ACC3C8B8_PYRYE|nr:hypothetical protein I4F81_008745 [Neopyropia yezoensis]
MTGAADVYKAVAVTAATAVQLLDAALYTLLPGRVAAVVERHLLPYWHAELRAGGQRCPGLRMPDPRPTLRVNGLGEEGDGTAAATFKDDHLDSAAAEGVLSTEAAPAASSGGVDSGPPPVAGGVRWGLLLPLTSRPRAVNADSGAATDDDEGDVWARLEATAAALVASVPLHRRTATRVYIAVDARDPAFDCASGRARLQVLFGELGGPTGVVDMLPPLPPAYNGALCWIWAALARRAARDGADLLVLLGDDVTLDAADSDDANHIGGSFVDRRWCWQQDVEDEFRDIATSRRLPYGFGVVALRDASFPVFPTFPVVHRLHLSVFRGHLFPQALRNQHGDPYLYELYRRWGAARFTSTAGVVNAIGGAACSRYVKAGRVAWRGSLLSDGIATLAAWLAASSPVGTPPPPQIPCVDVVVPTYRCQVESLRRLSALSCTTQASSIHTILVVDNPASPALAEVMTLCSYAINRTVRVHVMEANVGASGARNAGLGQAFGDWAVLLDDDVVPEAGLLDAYIGAIQRQPAATAFVGVTRLPPPVTLIQRSMAACRICFFYGIAEVTAKPPWGVTANLCVPARTNNRVWFSERYPRTGGGEDVDFCLRLQAVRGGSLVAVPGAVVVHPWWSRPLAQVAGWAHGDVRCLEALPRATFRAAPNWVEGALASLLAAAIVPGIPLARAVHAAVTGLVAAVLFGGLSLGATASAATTAALLVVTWTVASVTSVRGVPVRALQSAARAADVAVAHPRGAPPRAPPSAGLRMDLLSLTRGARPFVVLAHQRTGSNHLCSLLDSLTGGLPVPIAMHYEVLNERTAFFRAGRAVRDAAVLRARNADPEAFVGAVWADCGLPDGAGTAAAVGFKLFPEHMGASEATREVTERILADPRVVKVVLRRENRLDVAVSMLRAAITGTYLQRPTGHLRVAVSAADLHSFFVAYDAYYAYLRGALVGQPVVELTYAELVGDPVATCRRVVTALVGPARVAALDAAGEEWAPRSATRRQGDPCQPRGTVVAGLAGLRAAFVATPWVADFDDPPPAAAVPRAPRGGVPVDAGSGG